MSEHTQQPVSFATIGEVFGDGVSLIFDGQEEATQKHYKVNTSILFRPGDRVKIAADSGTYVVEYVVGTPRQPGEEVVGLPAGGTEGQALVKDSAEDFDAVWTTLLGLPSGGTAGQALVKDSAVGGDASWQTRHFLPEGGTAGQVLVKKTVTGGDAQWSSFTPDSVKAVANQISSSANYNIYFRTKATYGTPVFQIRMGSSGTWYTLTTE